MAHDFQPIITDSKLAEAMKYVAEQSLALARTVLARELSIDTICFFAQSAAEHAFLERQIRSRGAVSPFTHGPTLYVETDVEVAGQAIKLLGVRQPDKSRPEIGYGDYPVFEYERLLAELDNNTFAHEIISGRGQSLIELRHPDFDVRGYLLDAASHEG